MAETDRPKFLAAFPADPELEALVQAFEVGNYAKVRVEAPLLAKRTENEDVRRAALELRERIEATPSMRLMLAFTLVLLVFLSLYWIAKHGGPH